MDLQFSASGILKLTDSEYFELIDFDFCLGS